MIYNIVHGNDPSLMVPIEPFDFATKPVDPIVLANDMIETMRHHKGLGLSANQIGLPYRVFVLYSAEPLVCFNPRVVDQTTETVELEETCLSFPGALLKVKRPKVIKVRFQDATGATRTEKFIGMTARQFLHELDHLDGIVYTKRASRIHVDRAMRQMKQYMRAKKRNQNG